MPANQKARPGKSATALFWVVQRGLPIAQWMAAPMKSLVWLDVLFEACGEVAPKTFFTSNGARSSTMLAVEKAPTSQPARVKGTHGAGTFWPEGVVSAKELSAVAGVIRPDVLVLSVRLNFYRSAEYPAIGYRSINGTLPAIHDGFARET